MGTPAGSLNDNTVPQRVWVWAKLLEFCKLHFASLRMKQIKLYISQKAVECKIRKSCEVLYVSWKSRPLWIILWLMLRDSSRSSSFFLKKWFISILIGVDCMITEETLLKTNIAFHFIACIYLKKKQGSTHAMRVFDTRIMSINKYTLHDII